jgi:hypothetical protein
MRGHWRGTVLSAILAAAMIGCYAGWNAWKENRDRTVQVDIDGWGTLVQRLKAPGAGFGTLFSNPSLWKGPVVPFVFGLCYYAAPWDESVLLFNVIAVALAAGCFVIAFCSFGVDPVSALPAVVLGFSYWPHHLVYGYYYAEPLLALLLALLLLLVRWTVSSERRIVALLTGGVAGSLLLARPPFLLPVCATPLLLWSHSSWRGNRAWRPFWFILGLAVIFTPWTVRNYLAYRELIPFTTEGGKILFQGTYLPGDSVTIDEIRQLPEFAKLESAEGQNAIDQYRYWRTLAIQQICEHPLAQLRLCVRKAVRFWTYLPRHSWMPSWKTALVAAIALPLALMGVLLRRRLFLCQLCAVWITGLWVLHALVHAELRYNFPVLPLVFLLAILGFQQLCRRLFRAEANLSKAATTEPAFDLVR